MRRAPAEANRAFSHTSDDVALMHVAFGKEHSVKNLGDRFHALVKWNFLWDASRFEPLDSRGVKAQRLRLFPPDPESLFLADLSFRRARHLCRGLRCFRT